MRRPLARAFLALVLAFLALPLALPAGDDPGPLRRWSFDSEEDLRGWTVGRGIGDLRVAGGKLRGRVTDPDAYLFAPPVRAAMDGLVVRVRWSSAKLGGQGQCYFATDRSPAMGEDKVISRRLRPGVAVETEFPLFGPATRSHHLTRFRLDPFNGGGGGEFEIDEVTLLRLPPRLEVSFAPSRPVVAIGERVPFMVALRHLGGSSPSGRMEVRHDREGDVAPLALALAGQADRPVAFFDVAFQTPGVHVVRIRTTEEGRRTRELDASIAVAPADAPRGPFLSSRGAGVELLPAAGRPDAFAGGRLWARHGEAWKPAGFLLPLLEWVVQEDGVIRRTHAPLELVERTGRSMHLRSTGSTWKAGLTLGFREDREGAGGELLVAGASLDAPGAALLRFSAPVVRCFAPGVEPLDRHGLFGGVEFLAPGWRSSSDRAVGPRFADRWTPHPFKICLPVMAIEQGGVTTALLWDPLQEWAPGRRLPAATYASPNFPEEAADHRMQLSAPAVPEEVRENESLASSPFDPGGRTLRLSAALYVAAEKPVVVAARRWYEHFGIPAPPPLPHDRSTLHDLIARCCGDTLYWPGERGWRTHWFLDRSSHHRPEFAAELLLHARLTGDRQWLERTGVDGGASLIDTAGSLWDRARSGAAAATAAVRAMREDGTYAYRNTSSVRERTRKHTAGRFETLGEDGSTSLGTCVQGALPLLRHLLLTGEEGFLPPARRALEAMRRFRIPRGAQVWEVHQQIPDIRAAALAVDAFRIGYLVTGEREYLDDALHWAETGLPFLFSWPPPLEGKSTIVRTHRDRENFEEKLALPAGELFREPLRQVNPYGTIPVLGSSYYVVGWFGVLVQWCGLEWAWKVRELLELRDDPLLAAAARGVVRSGLQQMFDREPWTGLYPDVWNLLENWAGGALISPRFLVRALRAGGELPRELAVWSRRAGPGSSAPLVHGWGEVIACDGDTRALRVHLRYLAGEEGELLVARSPRPRAVRLGEEELPEAPTGRRGRWRYDRESRLLGIRFLPAGRDVHLSIDFD